MKKIISLLIIFTGTTCIAAAQNITFALSAGVAGASTSLKVKGVNNKWKKVEGLKNVNSFTGSISATIPLSYWFSFQPGITYLQKGFKTEDPGNTTTLLIDYIEVPVNIIYKTNNKKGGNNKEDDFFFGIGPSLAFATSGKMIYKSDSGSITEKIKFGNTDNDALKKLDVGANVTMGCQFFNNIFFSVCYNIGFTNLANDKDTRWKNNYLCLRVGYSFKANKK